MNEAPMRVEELQEKMMEIINDTPSMILTFRAKLVTVEMWEMAIAAEPALFRQCKYKTYSICMVALNKDGLFLEDIDPLLYTGEQYMNLCKVAVYQNPKAIILVPKEFRTTELKAYAYSQDPDILMSEKSLTPGMVEAILEHNPGLIRYVIDPTDDMLIKALQGDPRTIVYFKHVSPRVRAYFEETYPQYAAILMHGDD